MSLASEMRNLTNVSAEVDELFIKYKEENLSRIKKAASQGKNRVTLSYYGIDNKEQMKDWLTREGFKVANAIELGLRSYGEDSCFVEYVCW